MVSSVALVALTLACAACGAHSAMSGRNQYGAHEDGLAEATDRPSSVRNVSGRTKRSEGAETGENARERRSYFPWSNLILRAPSYQVGRPYVIPIWGAPGRIPIYFPPQQILLNPGYPPANPFNINNAYLPPQQQPRPQQPYPPPQPQNPRPANGGDEGIGDKFGDILPVWDEVQVTEAPEFAAPRPTRRRRPNTQTSTHPPLVHDVGNKANNLSPVYPQESQSFATTTRPPFNNFVPAQTRPPFTSRPPLFDVPAIRPTRPPPPPAPAAPQQRPSNCVWAIIQCCSGTSTAYSSQCFEERNCPGFFFDSSPCESDFAKAAIATASQYYSAIRR